MDEWNTYANSAERKLLVETQSKINEVLTEKIGLENKIYELTKQLDIQKSSVREIVKLDVNELVESFGNTRQERIDLTLHYLNEYGVLIVESKC